MPDKRRKEPDNQAQGAEQPAQGAEHLAQEAEQPAQGAEKPAQGVRQPVQGTGNLNPKQRPGKNEYANKDTERNMKAKNKMNSLLLQTLKD